MRRTLTAIMFLLAVVLPAGIYAQNIEVTITGIRSDRGQIAVGIFRDNETFHREEAYIELQFKKQEMKDGTMLICFSLEPGVYGLTLLDDENSNRKMEYNFLHIPREGFGFSGYYHTGLTLPKFDSFKFTVEPGQTKRITVRLRYL